jgi:hypothetical protein
MSAFSFDQAAIAKSHHCSAQRIAVNDEIVGDVGARHRKLNGYFWRVLTDMPQREAQNKRGDARLRLKTTNHQLMKVYASQLIQALRDQKRPIIMSRHCPVDRRRIQRDQRCAGDCS